MTSLKPTEIGTIAAHWELAELDSVSEHPQYGLTASAESKGNVKFLRITDIDELGVNWANVPFCTCDEKDLSKYLLHSGDIVFARIGATTGKSYLIKNPPESVFASYLIRVRAKPQIDSEFLSHFFQSDGYWRQINANKDSNLKKGVNGSVLRTLLLPKPPLDEQRRIAHILTTVQTAIEQQARLIALTRELKRALMRKLFTEGLRGEKQKETEIGLVPDGWDVLPLNELLTQTQYGLSVRGEEAGSYGILRMTNQADGKISTAKMQYVSISKKDYENYRLNHGDILFNRTNSIELVGRTAIFDIDGDYVFASYLIRVRTDQKRLNPFFLNHYLNWDESQKRLKTIALRAVSQSNISATRLRTFHVPVPTLDEQAEINQSIDVVNKKIGFHQQKKELLEELFRTLLHQLMTGEIRTDALHI
jgi:type I restriction enzyme S subunit